MTKEEIFREMDKCMNHGSLICFEKQVDRVLENFEAKEACTIIAMFISKKYSTFKADSMAGLLQSVIRKNPKLAQINHPENPLFKIAILHGSPDLYECYIEEAVEPFLKDKNEDTTIDYYTDLHIATMQMDEHLFPKYERCIKGSHFNGALRQPDNNLLSINIEDYDTMDEVVENHNAILGRRDILKDLDMRIENVV